MVGAEYLTAACGLYYYEVEVLKAEGFLHVGYAGTNLGPQCTKVGGDGHSWSFNMSTGGSFHR